MTGRETGAAALLVGAVRYALAACAHLAAAEMPLPTPCAGWNLGTLLTHLNGSMADLETALRTGSLDGGPPQGPMPCDIRADALPDTAAGLLWACYRPGQQFVAVAGVPIPAGIVACTGAVEIAVHGWDVSAARGRGRPIPPGLAGRLLALCPVLVAGREDLFADPVAVPPAASPSDRLVGFLGRQPRRPSMVTDER